MGKEKEFFEQRLDNFKKSAALRIVINILALLVTTGFLGMPSNLSEWLLRFAQSLAAFQIGRSVEQSLNRIREISRRLRILHS